MGSRVPGGFKAGCGEGGLGRKGPGPRKKAENNGSETEAQGTFGNSESTYFQEVEDLRGTIITVIMTAVFFDGLLCQDSPRVNECIHLIATTFGGRYLI